MFSLWARWCYPYLIHTFILPSVVEKVVCKRPHSLPEETCSATRQMGNKRNIHKKASPFLQNSEIPIMDSVLSFWVTCPLITVFAWGLMSVMLSYVSSFLFFFLFSSFLPSLSSSSLSPPLTLSSLVVSFLPLSLTLLFLSFLAFSFLVNLDLSMKPLLALLAHAAQSGSKLATVLQPQFLKWWAYWYVSTHQTMCS